MSKLQQQLKENKDKIVRDKFLSTLAPEFSAFLAASEFSSDNSCIKNAAFPNWNKETNTLTTTRGTIAGWNNFKFKTWDDIVAVLKKFQKVKNYIGWFFIDADGPYFRVSFTAFFNHIDEMTAYSKTHDHYTFGWVGDADDVGIIVQHNEATSGDKKFAISIWGL